MKGIVIYDSAYGNTRLVAEMIAETLAEAGISVDTEYVKKVKKVDPAEYDFLVLGSPTKFGTLSFTLKRFMGKIREKDWQGKPFAAFGTENPENYEKGDGSAALKIADRMLEKKMTQAVPAHRAIVYGMKGPLHEEEAENTKAFARELVTALQAAA